MADRSLPWTDIAAALGEERFVQLKEALGRAKVDELDRDVFLLNAAAGNLLRDLAPEDGPAETITAYGSLLHMLYLGWSHGWPVVSVSADALRRALASASHPSPSPLSLPTLLSPLTSHRFAYVQLPERLIWAEPESGASHEPVDGVFVALRPARLTALAVLGLRPDREGFTTMDADVPLPLPPPGPRQGGSLPFASTLPGGELARLLSVVDAQELAALALLALSAAEPA